MLRPAALNSVPQNTLAKHACEEVVIKHRGNSCNKETAVRNPIRQQDVPLSVPIMWARLMRRTVCVRVAAIAPSRLQGGAGKVMYASPCYTRAVALRTYTSLSGGHARMQCVTSATACHTAPLFTHNAI